MRGKNMRSGFYFFAPIFLPTGANIEDRQASPCHAEFTDLYEIDSGFNENVESEFTMMIEARILMAKICGAKT